MWGVSGSMRNLRKIPSNLFYLCFEEISSWERSGAQFGQRFGSKNLPFVGRDGNQLFHSGCWGWVLGAGAWESKGTGKAREAGEQGTRWKKRCEHKIIQKGTTLYKNLETSGTYPVLLSWQSWFLPFRSSTQMDCENHRKSICCC